MILSCAAQHRGKLYQWSEKRGATRCICASQARLPLALAITGLIHLIKAGLIASYMNVDEIAKEIGADSLAALSLKMVYIVH